MTAVFTIPPLHLTARAFEWLTLSGEYYPKRKEGNYKKPHGLAACDLHSIPVKQWSCGVEDMRAQVLGMKYVVRYVPGMTLYHNFGGEVWADVTPSTWKKDNITPRRPTCTGCKILLDKALENPMPKTGSYLKWYKKGHVCPNGFVVPESGLRWYYPNDAWMPFKV